MKFIFISIALLTLLMSEAKSQEFKPMSGSETPIEVFSLLNDVHLWALNSKTYGNEFVVRFYSYIDEKKTEIKRASFDIKLENSEELKLGTLQRDGKLHFVLLSEKFKSILKFEDEDYKPRYGENDGVAEWNFSGSLPSNWDIGKNYLILKQVEFRSKKERKLLSTWVVTAEIEKP